MEWLAIIVGTIAVLVTAFLRGAKSAEGETAKEVIDNVAKAKKAANDVASDDISTVRNRLRDNARK